MVKEYKEQLLKSLGVYELRELARGLGVVSPTTKKRKQLEQEIIKISKGELTPKLNTNKKGRPPKSIKKIESVLDVFIPKELLELTLNRKIDGKLEDIIRLSSSEAADDMKIQISGFIRKTGSGYYYFRNQTNIEEFVSVSEIYVEKFGLVEGDKLTAICQKTSADNYYTISELLEVNNSQPSEKRHLADIEEIVLSETQLKGFEGVYEGQNVFLVTEGLKSGIESVKKALQSISDDYHLVFLAPSISTYIKLFLEKDFKAELIYSLIEDHPAYVYDNILNACNHIDVLLREGKKIVVVALDIFTLVNSIENFFVLENQKQSPQESIEAIRIVKKFFNYGKVLESGASVTVFAHCLTSETEENLFKNELSKLADNVFYL